MKNTRRREKFTPEAAAHTAIHFLGVIALYWLVIVPPLWISILGIVIEYYQIKLLGNCFLTIFAHKRGYMKGMSYWEYAPFMLRIKNYHRAKEIIDWTIKLTLVGILVARLILGLMMILGLSF